MVKHIPNIITCLNLASGIISIILIMNGNMVMASWLILLAMVFDFLDGFMARLLHAYSELGKELDSLADVVSFGVAPGLIVYSVLIDSFYNESSLFFLNHRILTIGIVIAVSVFMSVCAGLRLAKFNVDPEQTSSFKGLPTPANALAIISLVISANYSTSALVAELSSSPVILILISLSLSLLMVSRIDLLSLKFRSYGIKGNVPRYALVATTIASLIIAGIAALPVIIPLYILVSVIESSVKKLAVTR